MNAKTSRRGFLAGSLSFGMLGAGCCTRPFFGKKWYRGNLHMHTYWSDGAAFPEEAVLWYKSRGYHFVGLSDHNVFQDNPRKWINVAGPEKEAKGVARAAAERYLSAFPEAETRIGKRGRMQIRLKTFAELSAAYNQAGRFLLLADVEATRTTNLANGREHQLHMNYVNLPGLLDSYRAPEFRRAAKDRPVAEFLGETAGEVRRFAEKLKRPHLFILNHPIWRWYDVGPEALIDNPDVRFFELCNNGSPYAPAKGLPDDGFDTDRLWDVVNAFRARRGQPLLYGVGTDDTHRYFGDHGAMLMPGNAWSLVRAHALTPDALIEAMQEGDFVTCEMLEPSDVSFDRAARRLTVAVDAKTAVRRTVRFIVTKKDFSEKPVRSVIVRSGATPRFERTINVYDEKIGRVAKTVVGAPGEALSASYTMQNDDLYVRARIEEAGQPLCTAYLHPQGKHVAWTQPYR